MDSHSVLSALTAVALDAGVALGLDRDELLRGAGIDPALLADPDARVPLEQDLKLWEILSRQPIGLTLGEKIGMAGLGIVGYVMQHGATVGEAIEWLGRYRAVVHPDVVPRVEMRPDPDGDRLVFVRSVPPPWTRLREPVYASASSLVAGIQGISGRDIRARAITYPLPRPADYERHEQYFACPVIWSAPSLEVAFDASIIALELPRSDARLSGYLARRADELLQRLPEQAGYAGRARREIGKLLAKGEPRLAVVAQAMAVSDRTLHRRLADEGTGFAALVDEARRERALLLLDDRSLSCSEIAFLLGYSEPAPFFRAFRRWTGASPESYRKGH